MNKPCIAEKNLLEQTDLPEGGCVVVVEVDILLVGAVVVVGMVGVIVLILVVAVVVVTVVVNGWGVVVVILVSGVELQDVVGASTHR